MEKRIYLEKRIEKQIESLKENQFPQLLLRILFILTVYVSINHFYGEKIAEVWHEYQEIRK